MRQALEGLKVVEVGNILAGPWCGSMMADFGARVIKVEPPKDGDLMRNMGRFKNLWFQVDNRNKMTVTLNLKEEQAKKMLWELLSDADVLIENFRPGVFSRLGFSWEKLHTHNERLVYVVSSGYGQTGPYSPRPGFDRMGLAMGGFLEITGYPDTPPVKPGISAADFYTAMFACMGAMFAIYNRDQGGTGKGQVVDCSLSESVLRLQESILAEYSYDGSVRTRIGNGTTLSAPSGHFETKDGKYLALSILHGKMFKQWAEAIDRRDLAENPKYQTGSGIAGDRDKINGACADWVKQHTIEECLEILGPNGKDLPASRIYNVEDIMKDEHFKARNAIIEVETKEFGKIKMQNVCPILSATPGEVKWPGADLGEYNKTVFGELLGYTDEQLAMFKDQGIV